MITLRIATFRELLDVDNIVVMINAELIVNKYSTRVRLINSRSRKTGDLFIRVAEARESKADVFVYIA